MKLTVFSARKAVACETSCPSDEESEALEPIPVGVYRALQVLSFITAFSWVLIWAPNTSAAVDIESDFWVTNGEVRAIEERDGVIYVGGQFSKVGPNTGGGASIDAVTGEVMAPYQGVSGYVSAIAADGEGGWYIGGTFGRVGNVSRNRVAHIQADGTVSDWNPGASGWVRSIVISDDVVYVAGDFQAKVVAFERTTGAPTDFDAGEILGGSNIYHLLLDEEILYIAGTFGSIQDQSRAGMAAVDAETGALTSWDPGPNGYSKPFAVVGSAIYLGGGFSAIGGVSRNRLAAVDKNTGEVLPWNPGADHTVFALEVSGNTAYVGGSFSTVGGEPRSCIAAIDLTTGIPTSWNPAVAQPSWPDVRAIAVGSNSVYVGGDFETVGGEWRKHIAEIDIVTGAPTSWAPPAGSTVFALCKQGDSVFAGGTEFGGVFRNHLAAIDAETGKVTDWDAHLAATPGAAPHGVMCLEIDGPNLYVGGEFTHVGWLNRDRIAAVNRFTGVTTAWDPGSDSRVNVIAAGSDVVYVAGTFEEIAGTPRSGLAALDVETGLATDWAPEPNQAVNDILVDDTTVFIGGDFTQVAGQSRERLAAIDSATGSALPWSPGASSGVRALAKSGNTVFVGGVFGSIDGVLRERLAALDATTGVISPWNPGANGEVKDMIVDGPVVFASGVFTEIGGVERNGIAAVDAVDGVPLAWDAQIVGESDVKAVLPAGSSVYIGGRFTNVGNESPHRYFASLQSFEIPSSVDSPLSSTQRLTASPNPMMQTSVLTFDMIVRAKVDLRVFDVEGRQITVLINGLQFEAGRHEVALAAQQLPPGVYFARLEVGARTGTEKLLVVR